MMIAPSAAFGNDARTGVNATIVITTISAVKIDANGVREPAASLTAVREKPPVTGYPPKKPDATFAAPSPRSSAFGSISYRCLRA